ncbi:D-2-hydroxyacid dehydrogenase [Lentilactobacillus sp. SPB1-3]|uniref:D-2-hydroxyacid dehydrogenase n=1 Tax=Lentilactobacillus terminaliae TaxID=3003483 RepID=A0ACD5DFM6_9LACO|nr:D-2-hydroxyacid dehydrogenase [Lentilactobacillus sp. SPB1-3]MCZ0976583.1 D-2-hydroxyacid dehydrogenase [Lentilactobacillus sp. SPB1-3]
MKIVVLDGYALNPGDLSWKPLKNMGDVTIYDRTPHDQTEILKRIGDAEIVFDNKTPLDAEILNRTPNLKYIGILSTGYDIIDLAAAKQNDIVVTNIPAYGTDAVAQHTFALLLEITNRVGLHNQLVHDGVWAKSPDYTFWDAPLVELRDKTVGLFGFGKIAQQVARLAHAFSMKVIYYNHRPKPFDEDWATQVDMDALFAQSDIISMHTPLTPETNQIIDCDNITKMKDGVIIINTARGGLIEEESTADALNSGKIAALGTDVASHEPINQDNPLLSSKNTFITPHIAWAPLSTRARLLDIAIDNFQAYLDGKPVNTVEE